MYDVKKNFKASAELLREVTKAYVCEAFMEWAGFDTVDGTPTNITIRHPNVTNLAKKIFMESVTGKFVDEFILPNLDAEKAMLHKTSQGQTATGIILHILLLFFRRHCMAITRREYIGVKGFVCFCHCRCSWSASSSTK